VAQKNSRDNVWENDRDGTNIERKEDTFIKIYPRIQSQDSETITELPKAKKLKDSETILELSNIDKPSDRSDEEGATKIDREEIIVESQVEKKEFKRAKNSELGTYLGLEDRYRLDKLLAVGGMGKVYLAVDTKLSNRQVALKVMTNYSSDRDTFLKRFEQEVKIIASLNSINIVKLDDYGLSPNNSPFFSSPFYVMEYLEGETLGALLDRTIALPSNRAIAIALQICSALNKAHQQGIIHRDLKPENIFLISGGALGEIVKVLDFGIAKIVDEDKAVAITGINVPGGFLGSYRYASPQQCRGQTINAGTDIYSLGMVLYEMLSGTNPFGIPSADNDNQKLWFDSHLYGKIVPIRQQKGCESLEPQLEEILNKCLAKRTEERFASIDLLEIALNKIITH
jgi:serine/threonine protein kinase